MRLQPPTEYSPSTLDVSSDQEVLHSAHLEDVVPWLDVRHIDPLTVYVMSVGVPAACCDALGTKVGTLELLLNTCQPITFVP